MKTVQRIIEAHGGLEALRNDYIRIENEPWMRLVIEHIGTAPSWLVSAPTLPLISVAHYGEQNGDAMRDPEIVFHVQPVGGKIVRWTPRTFQNDYVGHYSEVFVVNEDGKPMYKPKLLRELTEFSRMWDKNIQQQGFFEAYLKARAAKINTGVA